MPLIRNRNTFRISPSDWINGFLITKIVPGENVAVDIEPNGAYGEQLVISANKSQGRKAIILTSDGVVGPDVYLVVVDASHNPVVVTLPVAHDYLGQLSIVCADASNGITLIPNASTKNVIFDDSNIKFNAKGDAVVLVSDRGRSEVAKNKLADDEEPDEDVDPPHDILYPGTWYAVGRYVPQWYA